MSLRSGAALIVQARGDAEPPAHSSNQGREKEEEKEEGEEKNPMPATLGHADLHFSNQARGDDILQPSGQHSVEAHDEHGRLKYDALPGHTALHAQDQSSMPAVRSLGSGISEAASNHHAAPQGGGGADEESSAWGVRPESGKQHRSVFDVEDSNVDAGCGMVGPALMVPAASSRFSRR